MALNSKLLESYNNVRTNYNESAILNTTKEKVLNMFRKKAPKGVLNVDGENFTEDMVRGALDTFADEDTIKDYLSFLGLNAAPIAENNKLNLTSEDIANKIKTHVEQGDFDKVTITTHYGNITLPIVEIWTNNGVLSLSVDNTNIEKN